MVYCSRTDNSLLQIAEERTIEQRALAAAAPTESIRFLMEMDNNSEEKEEENSKSPVLGGKVEAAFVLSILQHNVLVFNLSFILFYYFDY